MGHDISAYLRTKVPYHRTQEVITRLLEKNGIDEIRFTHLAKEIRIEFNYPQDVDGKCLKLGVRFVMPIPEASTEKERIQARDQRYRALFYILKTKLEAVEFGLREFGQEFLGDLIYRLPNGKVATVSEIIGPQLQENLLAGKSELLMLTDK